MPSMIIVSPDPVGFAVDRCRFEEAAIDRFGDQVKIIPARPGRKSQVDLTARITRPGEPAFQIFHFEAGDAISVDGTTEQAVEVMLWTRSLLPDNLNGPVWAIDEGYTGHVELVAGMTEADIRSGWVEHDESATE